MPSVRTKLRLCSNQGALQQRSEEEELSLAQLRQLFKRHNSQYQHTNHAATTQSSKVDVAPLPAFEMADAIGIADTINLLAASLKDMAGESSDGDFADMAELQEALEKATKTLQSFRASRQAEITTMLPTKDVTFYDGKVLPKSPLKSSTTTTQTPRRSNVSSSSSPLQVVTGRCPSPQRLLQTALSCSSGFLATIGDDDGSPPPTPGLLELMDDEEKHEENKLKKEASESKKPKTRRKQGKKLSLDFTDFAGYKDEGKKNIQITKGDIDIRIWGPSVGGLTLTTGGTSASSGDNDSSPGEARSGATWVIRSDRKDSEGKTAIRDKPRSSCTKPTPNDDRHRAQHHHHHHQQQQQQKIHRKSLFPWPTMKGHVKRERLEEKGATTRTDLKRAPSTGSSHGSTHLENLVLGAMNPHHNISTMPGETAPATILRNKKSFRADKKVSVDAPAPAAAIAPAARAHDRDDKHRNDLLPAMSNLSYFSGVLPNGGEKLKAVKTDHEKGFEVYLEEDASELSQYSPKKLRERAALSEKLLAKRREILSIQKDLQACSQLLGSVGSRKSLRSGGGLAVIDEPPTSLRYDHDPPPAASSLLSSSSSSTTMTTTNHSSTNKWVHGSIIRE
jgi:hypothetical protein